MRRLVKERVKVENVLIEPASIKILQQTLTYDGRVGFDMIIGPFHELFKLSDAICISTVEDTNVMKTLVQKLKEEKVALNRVKIVKLICLIWKHVRTKMSADEILRLHNTIQTDGSILVREIGKKLISDVRRRNISERMPAMTTRAIRDDIAYFVLSE